MRYLVLVAALSLSACAGMSLSDVASTGASVGAATADTAGVPPPSTVANATKLDESLARGAEALYKGFRTYAEAQVDQGKVKGAKATKLADLDKKAFAALGVVRSAYDSGNSGSYVAALAKATQAVADCYALIKGDGN